MAAVLFRPVEQPLCLESSSTVCPDRELLAEFDEGIIPDQAGLETWLAWSQSMPLRTVATSCSRRTVVLCQLIPLARKCSGTEADANALPTGCYASIELKAAPVAANFAQRLSAPADVSPFGLEIVDRSRAYRSGRCELCDRPAEQGRAERHWAAEIAALERADSVRERAIAVTASISQRCTMVPPR